MIASVKHEIAQLVIVDNSCSNYRLPDTVRHSAHSLRYIRPVSGLGYGGAINQGIMQSAWSPWWMWSSNDLVYTAKDTDYIAKTMNEATEPLFVSYGFTYGALNQKTVDSIGLVDEWNFFPIYYDDNDYYRRLRLGNIKVIDYKGDITHGEDGRGSLTINSDEKMKSANHRSFDVNKQRYIDKWGGEPRHETFDTPFNSGLPLWATQPNMLARSKRLW